MSLQDDLKQISFAVNDLAEEDSRYTVLKYILSMALIEADELEAAKKPDTPLRMPG